MDPRGWISTAVLDKASMLAAGAAAGGAFTHRPHPVEGQFDLRWCGGGEPSATATARVGFTAMSSDTQDLIRLLMNVVISLALLGAGLYVLLGDHGSADLQKVAGGWIGLVAGYWLK